MELERKCKQIELLSDNLRAIVNDLCDLVEEIVKKTGLKYTFHPLKGNLDIKYDYQDKYGEWESMTFFVFSIEKTIMISGSSFLYNTEGDEVGTKTEKIWEYRNAPRELIVASIPFAIIIVEEYLKMVEGYDTGRIEEAIKIGVEKRDGIFGRHIGEREYLTCVIHNPDPEFWEDFCSECKKIVITKCSNGDTICPFCDKKIGKCKDCAKRQNGGRGRVGPSWRRS